MFRRALPVVCLLALVLVTESMAQDRGRGGPGGSSGGDRGGDRGGRGGYSGRSSRSSPVSLLGQESVQKELQLTPKQVQALASISEQQRAAISQAYQLEREERYPKIEEINKQTEGLVGQVITPQQLQRLMQISIQQQGTRAFERPEVIEGLGLTQEQLSQISQIREATSEEMQELFRKQMEEIRKASEKKVVAVFSPQQQAQWSQVRGETFEGEIVSTRYGSSRSSSPGETIRSPGEEALRGSSSSSQSSKPATADSTRGRPTTTPPRSAAMNAPAKKPTAAKTPAKVVPKKTTPATTKKPAAGAATAPAAQPQGATAAPSNPQ
ncbi:MAG TPA: hypothetical protein VHY20_02365 [Pirellulales bacterium]|jgi:hypothetical protein|nr:hypothetical protein [Pirellulales bacterium]